MDNIESDWPYHHKFDFIFARYLTSSLKDYPGVINKAFELSAIDVNLPVIVPTRL